MSCTPWSNETERANYYKAQFESNYKHLKKYEDTGLTPKKIKDLQVKVVELEPKLQGHIRDLFNLRESVIDGIVDYLRELGLMEASMA